MAESVPDSWDADNGTHDEGASIEKPMSSLSFNPNAISFVPGKNVHASSFVPCGATEVPGNSSPNSYLSQNESEEPAPSVDDVRSTGQAQSKAQGPLSTWYFLSFSIQIKYILILYQSVLRPSKMYCK